MSAVSETIVREYFELHGFFLQQQRKYVAPSQQDEQIDFLVINPQPSAASGPLPFVLGSSDLDGIRRAVVAVRGWHTEVFRPAVLRHAPWLFRFAEPSAFVAATRALGGDEPVLKILAVPALPQSPAARARSIEFLRSKGVDAVIPFSTMLADLIQHTETNRNYQKSDLLQIIRILKTYGFFKDPQLELFKPGRRSRSRQA
jgi:hypothetical protein